MFDLKVKLDRKDIINKLSENKIKHQAEYEDALQGYIEKKKNMVLDLDKQMGQYYMGEIKDDPIVSTNFGLSKPIDNSEKYDELINAFRMVKEETLELDFEDAKNIANDSFKWLEASKLVNSFYSNAR